jgi:hypothetical protein
MSPMWQCEQGVWRRVYRNADNTAHAAHPWSPIHVTPTALTLRLLRRRGYMADVCERWLPHTDPPMRRDLFGGFDVVAIHRDIPGVLGVQTTSLANLPARVAKLRPLASVAAWLKCGNRVQVHGWERRGRNWTVKVVELSPDDLAAIVTEQPRRRLPNRHHYGDLFAGVTQETAL